MAIVDRSTGLLGSSVVELLFRKIWLGTATRFGPSIPAASILKPSHAAQKAVRSFYYDVYELSKDGGWGSASRAALGKMEYHVPSTACLTAFHGLPESLNACVIPDNAMKCVIPPSRFFIYNQE